jgi:para-nitrobenzyl esterase
MIRKTFLALGMLAAASIAAQAQVVEAPVPNDPVLIESGRIAGKLLPSGVRAYWGVPFAAPPVGDLRWREPQALQPWRGVYNADRFAPECMQILRPHNINHYFGEEATSEDCLYLNIWAPPDATPESKAPVIVWIYGGGFSIGSASMANYGGENLAKKGVVYVSIAYRVGALGFMAHPALSASAPHGSSGNYGHLDQVAALKWIQRNIANLGGDPARVTVMGQSAGASSAFSLQVSPLARGLFHRIVGMSGGGLRAGVEPQTKEQAERSGLELENAMKVDSLGALRNLPADRIVDAQAEFQLGGTAGTVRFAPSLDSYFMPRAPRATFAAGEQHDVPLLLGFARDESSNELRQASTVLELRAAAEKYFGSASGEFLRLYRPTAANARQVGAAATRDGGMATSIRNWALAHLATGTAPAYIYMYAHPHSYAPGVQLADLNPETAGAYHTSDVPFFLLTLDVYNRVRRTREWTAYDRLLAEQMSDALVAFARTADPTTQATAFPRFDVKSQRLVEFANPVRTIRFERARMDFLAQFNLPGVVGPAPSRGPRD